MGEGARPHTLGPRTLVLPGDLWRRVSTLSIRENCIGFGQMRRSFALLRMTIAFVLRTKIGFWGLLLDFCCERSSDCIERGR